MKIIDLDEAKKIAEDLESSALIRAIAACLANIRRGVFVVDHLDEACVFRAELKRRGHATKEADEAIERIVQRLTD